MVRIALLFLTTAATAATQNVHQNPPPEVRAARLASPVAVDGRLDEDIWSTAPVAGGFRQLQPNEGQPGSQRTEVRFAFDAEAIYVGAHLYDENGAEGIERRLVRRDGSLGQEYFQVIFDTYHDHIGRLFFSINPSGVRNDANGLGGGGDPSWDPVWEVATAIDSLGWTAEMRIPFSQLRFPPGAAEQTWGLQIWRQVTRLNELSQWAFWGITEAGGPPRFGHLEGLVIGRAPEAALQIDSGGVSRLHARITVRGGEVRVEDLGSKNGTFVGGEPVSGARVLADGDEPRIGPVSLTFTIVAAQPTETMQ